MKDKLLPCLGLGLSGCLLKNPVTTERSGEKLS